MQTKSCTFQLNLAHIDKKIHSKNQVSRKLFRIYQSCALKLPESFCFIGDIEKLKAAISFASTFLNLVYGKRGLQSEFFPEGNPEKCELMA
ncbi:MAG TPA: hypothetical protein VI564_00285, partial [Candidatus Nanoarchaeia archaeon]|nr:hypothetical protein [Candidatus Nanoarchaeia archaeon]